MKVKICAPITGSDKSTIVSEAVAIAKSNADVAEFRYDLYDSSSVDKEKLTDDLLDLLSSIKKEIGDKELLFTIRTSTQGGHFPYVADSYELLCTTAVESGDISMLDIEDSTMMESVERLVKVAREHHVKTISSYHDFKKTPELSEIIAKLDSMKSMGTDVLKCAYMPEKAQDVARLLEATAIFKEQDMGSHELITMSMGKLGKISRVSGAVFGSDYTFAAVAEASAPGQMPIDTAASIMEELER